MDETPLALPEPEVDLDFPEFGDPFNEEFAEEELVLNQYAADIEIFADLPRVSSWEGRQIGALLDSQHMHSPRSEPLLSPEILAPVATIPTFTAASDPVLPEEPIFPEDLMLPEEPDEALASSVELTVSAAAPLETPGPTAAPAPQAAPSPSVRPIVLPPPERARIVIEEPLPKPPAAAAKPRAAEFRQLFSKLRRG
jgi:hypothetical protein